MGLLFSCQSSTDFTSGFLEASLNVRGNMEENRHTDLGAVDGKSGIVFWKVRKM